MAANFEALVEAVKTNSLTRVKKIVSQKHYIESDINKRDTHKRNILHLALKSGGKTNRGIVELLLKNHCDVNAQDQYGNTPLHLAVNYRSSNSSLIKLLLQYGADVNARGNKGRIPFFFCFESKNRKKNEQLINLMLKYQTDINTKDLVGRNVLHYVAEYGNIEIIKRLIQLGIKMNEKDCKGNTPLHVALRHGCNLASIELLLYFGADLNIEDKSGITPFFFCLENEVCHKNTDLVNLILDYQENVNAKCNKVGKNALHYVAQHGTSQMVKKLIQEGIDVNEIDDYGSTPLHFASTPPSDKNIKNTLKKIRLLVVNGADVNVQNADDDPPLISATWDGTDSLLICQCLLKFGADPNIFGICPPLYYAIRYNEVELIKLFLSHGADVFYEDENGCSLLNATMPSYLGTLTEPPITMKLLMLYGAMLTEDDDAYVIPENFILAKRCQKEVHVLQVTKIYKASSLTFYDFLQLSNEIAARYLRREDFSDAMKSGEYKKKFIYFSINIEAKYLRGMELIKMSNDFVDLLNEVFGAVLPYDVTVLISKHFNEEDLCECFNKKLESSNLLY